MEGGSVDGERTRLRGVLDRVTFSNPENGFLVGRAEAEGHAEPVTVVGTLADVPVGGAFEAEGEWVQNPKFGVQFKVTSYQLRAPDSGEALKKYLAGGAFKGIGEKTAERIVATFGDDTRRVLDEDPRQLRKVKGLRKAQRETLEESWATQQVMRELQLDLQALGLGPKTMQKLIEAYGRQALTVLRSEPYRVAQEVPLIGFQTADQLGLRAGLQRDSPERLRSGLLYLLEKAEEDGHTAYPREDFLTGAARQLQVAHETMAEALTTLENEQAVVPSLEGLLQRPNRRRQEEQVAEAIARLAGGTSRLPSIQAERAVRWAEEKAGFAFAEEQREAILTALREPFSILTGGPGTGKTTLLRALVAIVRAKRGRVVLASPTGRAAQRLAESARHPAATIHRMLAFDPARGKFTVNASRPLEADLLIVDEVGMLDLDLAWHLLRAVEVGTHLVLVGDADQLPSVGAGQVLADLLAVPGLAVTRLQRLFRQGERSLLAQFAAMLREGRTDCLNLCTDDPAGELVFWRESDPERAAALIVEETAAATRQAGGRDPTAVQLLTAMHRGAVGTRALNESLQRVLNPSWDAAGAGGFAAGDKVLVTRNDYDRELFNGDIGIVREVTSSRLEASFSGNRQSFGPGEFDPLQLAYALTVHKAQGSEYGTVFIPIAREQTVLLERQLIYTAVTRAKKRLVLVGDGAVLARAIRSARGQVRHTGLRSQLSRALPG